MTVRLTIGVFRYRLPFVKPWRYGGRTLTHREGRLVRIDDAETGRVGWGEAAPLPGFGVEELQEIDRALKSAIAMPLSDDPVSLVEELNQNAWQRLPASRCALVTALMDASCAGSLASALTPNAARRVKCHLAAGAVMAPVRILDSAWQTAKLKVGLVDNPRAEATALLAWISANPMHRFRLDASGQWDAARLRSFCNTLGAGADHVELLEQPTPPADVDALLDVASWSPIPIWADESVVSERWRELRGGVAGIVLKPMVCGGPDRAMAIAGELGLSAMVTTSLETAVGRAMCLHVAAALDVGEHRAHGLATGSWLAGDVLERGESTETPLLFLSEGPGLGLPVVGGADVFAE
jgi:O-succinylbenzoate synthase